MFRGALQQRLGGGGRSSGPHDPLIGEPSRERQGYVEIEIRNTGTPYPETVLTAQAAQPLSDSVGPGLGLLLVRRTLEQVSGSLLLANAAEEARTVVWIAEPKG